MQISFLSSLPRTSHALVIPVLEGKKLTVTGTEADRTHNGLLSRTLKAHGRFTGKKGQFVTVYADKAACIVMMGIGEAEKVDVKMLQSVGGLLVSNLNAQGIENAVVQIDQIAGIEMSRAEMAMEIAFGAQLKSYRFDKYRTKEKPEAKPTLKTLGFVLATADSTAAKKAFARYEAVAQSVNFTRDLLSEPANILYPVEFVRRAKEELAPLGVKVEVLGEAQMQKLGMGALLGVGQGSARESQMLIMSYNGAKNAKEQPIAFVGKGVCFDTGGISIKPSAGMEEMKWDMGGAGVVTGLMRALAARKAKVNVVCVAGLVENMPDGNAQRPGDVVTTMSGQTVEVINTDAEGRLVLADALWYTQNRFKPRFMVDLATLTGAIIVAIGSSRAGLFSSDDALAQQLFTAGEDVGERLWRLPVGDEYDEHLDSPIADMHNVGKNREAGSISAAQFLWRFTNGVPWAHLDIAGVVWPSKDLDTTPKGAHAFGLRLLDRFVADNFEK